MKAILQSTISMHSMLMLGVWGMPPRKILKNRSSEIEFEGISESQSCMQYQIHNLLNAIQLQLLCRWIWDMHADLMVLYLLYLWIMTDLHKVKDGQNICQSHYHLLLRVILVQLNIVVWASFSRQLLSVRRLLTGLCNSDKYRSPTGYVKHHGRFLENYSINHLNCLIVERVGFMLTEASTRLTILLIQIYEYHALLLSSKLNMRASLKSYQNHILEIRVSG